MVEGDVEQAVVLALLLEHSLELESEAPPLLLAMLKSVRFQY